MPRYMQLGTVPSKRHIRHQRTDDSFLDEGVYYEELITLDGFERAYSCLYHLRPPTRVRSLQEQAQQNITSQAVAMQPKHIRTQDIARTDDHVQGRRYCLRNNDVLISRARPSEQQQLIYRNAGASELLFIASGSGKMHSAFGVLSYKQFDYVLIPQGVAYQLIADDISKEDYLIIESPSIIDVPQRYLNPDGQLKLGAPYSERDMHGPSELLCIDKAADTNILCKQDEHWQLVTMAQHPFDVQGWDGCVYPFTINALNFEPITGTVHQPPPIHQLFEAEGFVICNFAPRHLDHHPQAIKVPYAHSNVHVDEVLFYVDGNFSSRKGIDRGSMTVHPRGLVHGPHPGCLKASDDETFVNELAVMIDVIMPLELVTEMQQFVAADYEQSWME